MGMASNIEHTHVFLHRWLVWPTPPLFVGHSCRTDAFFFPSHHAVQHDLHLNRNSVYFPLFSRSPNGSSHIPDVTHSAGEWQCSPGDSGSLSPSTSSPGRCIVLHSASIHPFGESSITAALYSIIVTLIKAPSPDPFPEEWETLTLCPEPWDNGPCYRGEQGPTVSRLLLYSPGLITLAIFGCITPGKSPGSGEPTVNSGFTANAGTGICQKTWGKAVTNRTGSIQIQKTNRDCRGEAEHDELQ